MARYIAWASYEGNRKYRAERHLLDTQRSSHADGSHTDGSPGREIGNTPMAWRIVVIDHVGSPLNYAGLLAGCRFDRLEWVSGAPGRLRECKGDLLIASALGDGSAPIELFRWLLANPVPMPVFAIVPEHADDELLRITARMAADFAVWPARPEEIHHRVARILGAPHSEVDAVADRLSDEVSLRQLVGRDPGFLHVIAQIPLVARSNRPVLITGETGTGKELCARAIHHLGRRRDYPFVAVDCGAFPDSLFENELFGHDPRRVHRRPPGTERARRDGRGRHAVPRRDRLAVAVGAGQAPALPAGADLPAARRPTGSARGRERPRRPTAIWTSSCVRSSSAPTSTSG